MKIFSDELFSPDLAGMACFIVKIGKRTLPKHRAHIFRSPKLNENKDFSVDYYCIPSNGSSLEIFQSVLAFELLFLHSENT